MSIERNSSPWTRRDLEAQNLVGKLREDDEQGVVNIDHIRFLRTKIIGEWVRDGYDPQLFSSEEGLPIILARHEDEAMFDGEGNVRPGVDVRYRFYLNEETKSVTVPAALAGNVPPTIEQGVVTIYDTASAEALEAMLDENAGAVFTEDVEWLVRHFGRSLTIVRGHLKPTRLETDERVVGIALNDLTLFRESDF